MKHIKIIGLVGLLLAGSALAKSKLVLGELDGLPEPCEVKSYDGRKKIVKMQASTGLISWPLSSFRVESQAMILEWVADYNFEASARLRVKIKDEVKTKKYKNGSGEVEIVIYMVELENRGSVDLKAVEVESLVFYETLEIKTEANCKSASKHVVDIPAGKKIIFKSKPVQIRDVKAVQAGFYFVQPDPGRVQSDNGRPTAYYRDKLKGACFYLRRRDCMGKSIVREFKHGSPPKPDKRHLYLEDTRHRIYHLRLDDILLLMNSD